MSSGISINVKLDPFYQQFLRGYYNCNDEVFKFPRASRYDYLPYSLIPLLWYSPEGNITKDYGRENFMIFLPEMLDKNIYAMNYISENGMKSFSKVVERFYIQILRPYLTSLFEGGHGPHESVQAVLEKFRISDEFKDRLLKDYTRWYYWNKKRTYRMHLSKNLDFSDNNLIGVQNVQNVQKNKTNKYLYQ